MRSSRQRITTQTVLPAGETAAMLFWALLAFGQRKVYGRHSLDRGLAQPRDLAAS
jgi:hypothetical protein